LQIIIFSFLFIKFIFEPQQFISRSNSKMYVDELPLVFVKIVASENNKKCRFFAEYFNFSVKANI